MDLLKALTLEGDAYRALYGAARAKAYLEAGITAVQDLGNSGRFADIALRKAIDEGLVPGPRMQCAGQGLSAEGGQIPEVIYQHRNIIDGEYRVIKSIEDARQAVRENYTQGADVIKVYADNAPNKARLSIEEIETIVKEAHRYGLRVTAHATSNISAWTAAMAGVDGIEHGNRLQDSILLLMKQKNIVLVPTDGDSTVYAAVADTYDFTGDAKTNFVKNGRKSLTDRIQRAVKAGVTLVAGSDDYTDIGMPFAEPSIRNLIGYQQSGLSSVDVLKMATVNAAKHLRWENKAGVIKKGAFADIIAVDMNVEMDLKALLKMIFVMKEGKVYVDK